MSNITIDKAVLEQALEALEKYYGHNIAGPNVAITALRQAMEQPAQQSAESVEPVAWLITFEKQDGSPETCAAMGRFKDVQASCDFGDPVPLYTHPPVIDKSAAIRIATALGWEPKREWQELTHEDIHALMNEFFYKGMQPSGVHFANFARAIEAKLKEKNT